MLGPRGKSPFLSLLAALINGVVNLPVTFQPTSPIGHTIENTDVRTWNRCITTYLEGHPRTWRYVVDSR